MCFANKPLHRTDLTPKYDQENGTISDTVTSNVSNPIPVDIPEHVDNPFLNTEIEDGILALIYETQDEVITVWTSQEACEIENESEETPSYNSEID